MQRLILLQPTPNDPEIAIVRVSGTEHSTLHKPGDEGKNLVNSNHVFTKDATKLTMRACEQPNVGCLVVLQHPLQCYAVGSCVAA